MGMRIPDGGSIFKHRCDVHFIGWVSDAVTAGSEESSSAIQFLSNRIDVVIKIQFGVSGNTEVLGRVNQFKRLAMNHVRWTG